MAIRKNNVLGLTSGKLGNTVTRIRNGKEVVYALPDKVKVSNSKQAKAARNKFALTVGFAKFINSIPALSSVWNNAKISGTNSFQKLIKQNLKLTGENYLTLKNIITPAGFDISLEKFSLLNDAVSFSIRLSENIPLELLSSNVHIHAVLYFYEPRLKKDKPFVFSHLSVDDQVVVPNTTVDIRLDLNTIQKNLFLNYKQAIIYLAVI